MMMMMMMMNEHEHAYHFGPSVLKQKHIILFFIRLKKYTFLFFNYMRANIILSSTKRRIKRSNRIRPYPITNHRKMCHCKICKKRKRDECKFACKALLPLILLIIGLSFL